MLYPCIYYLLLHNRFPPNLAPQNTIFYLPFSVSQRNPGMLRWFVLKVSWEGLVRLSAGAAVSSEGLTGEQSTSNLNQVSVGRPQLLGRRWTWGLSSSLDLGLRQPLTIRASPKCSFQHSCQLLSEQVTREREWEKKRGRWKTQSFYDVFSEEANDNFCYVLFSKLRVSNSFWIHFYKAPRLSCLQIRWIIITQHCLLSIIFFATSLNFPCLFSESQDTPASKV